MSSNKGCHHPTSAAGTEKDRCNIAIGFATIFDNSTAVATSKFHLKHEEKERSKQLAVAAGVDASATMSVVGCIHSPDLPVCFDTGPNAASKDQWRERERASVIDHHRKLGALCTRRTCRMNPKQFWKLVVMTKHHMPVQECPGPNGPMPKSLRVSAAIRPCAGGSPCDMSLTFGKMPPVSTVPPTPAPGGTQESKRQPQLNSCVPCDVLIFRLAERH